ncbi:MAG: hypothetical protein KA362_15685 [Chloroflexi bacterium]|nr:hypothetical protein [Chloroflexota bacterium]MBP6805554.1 hypothetical protein [Chloroflexota bacterium]
MPMWRWVTVILVVVILGRPVMLMDNPACDRAAETAVPTTPTTTPCHDTVRLAEANANTRSGHTCPCPDMVPPTSETHTAVSLLIDSWAVLVYAPHTAVNAPPNPPPRFL